jgi:hypothetical protein
MIRKEQEIWKDCVRNWVGGRKLLEWGLQIGTWSLGQWIKWQEWD